jgi:hypothetical protein
MAPILALPVSFGCGLTDWDVSSMIGKVGGWEEVSGLLVSKPQQRSWGIQLFLIHLLPLLRGPAHSLQLRCCQYVAA